ncbi:MAG: glycoside hydrolase family 97 protein [Muribaculaceae bacterium]|nr:glycoside hydrolase family 97 protein [Muribaculaceae bacterium]
MSITSNTILSGMLLCALSTGAADYTLTSPDGKTAVTVNDNGNRANYSVTHSGKTFVAESPLGLKTNIGDYTGNLKLMKASEPETVSDSYSLRNIKNSHVNYKANRQTYTFAQDGKAVMDVEMEVSDNNVALRYRVLPQGPTLCCVVEEESTGFAMPEGTTTFLCPQSGPMGGFARTSPSYETHYTADDATGKNGWGEGYTFPCLFRNGEDGWTLISETGIAGDYCGSHLKGNQDGSYTIAYPMQGEQNGFGSTGAMLALPGYTPWRTITVGETLAPIAETTVSFDVVEPLYEPKKDYKYGRGMWSWIIKMDPSCNFDEQKRYIDFAADMGYESVLVDALWDTQIGREGIEELARYGKEKGVGLYLWYNSNGSWNDAPQGPRGIMGDIVKRRKDMAWMEKNDIRGIKVDFFAGDKQETMRLYHDILADANDHGLLVIFHGCTLPRGWDRMYPNYAASEAVRASENLHFSQGECDNEAFAATFHPLVRNTVGSMDFGGSALNKYYNANNEPRGSKRMTSDVFALAVATLFQSPVQHFALAPNNLEDAPEWAIDFMKRVPTTWDETRFIEGYPGKYIVLARRQGDRWIVSGINATDETMKIEVELPEAMKQGYVNVYSDNDKLEGSVKKSRADKKGRVKVTMPKNGGFVIDSAN